MTGAHDLLRSKSAVRPYAEVIGDPIKQSKSPAIHGFWRDQLGLEADYYATLVEPENLAAWLASRRNDPLWRGANVTMPHKQAVMPLLDRIDSRAERIGAVNTVIPDRDGAITGYNTDADGFLEPLRPQLAHNHLFRMARIIGTGGAARAIVAALAEHHFTIVLVGRDPLKAELILAELDPDGDHYCAPLDHFSKPTDFAFDDREEVLDLVVNASPLGMEGQPELAFDISHAPPGSVFYDIVTHPVETDFLRVARGAGFPTIDGLAMLIGQAAAAFEKFFGEAPPRERDQELREVLLK